jgi:hypothetical protein
MEQVRKHGEDVQMSSIYGAEHLLRLFGSSSLPHRRLASSHLTVDLPRANSQPAGASRSHDHGSRISDGAQREHGSIPLVRRLFTVILHAPCADPVDPFGFTSWLDLNKKILFVNEYDATSSGYQNMYRAA